MEKKTYKSPTIEVITPNYEATILAGSGLDTGVDAKISERDNATNPWASDPNSSSDKNMGETLP